MSDDSAGRVTVWVEDARGATGTKNAGGGRSRATKALIPVEILKKNLATLTGQVGEVFEHVKAVGAFELDEVSLQVEVNAEGGLEILGTGGRVGGSGAVTLKFKKAQG